ncbi:excisionase family DNA-binding protein [Patulibacter brassicae]|uniref:Excisionase family DNA-binding protein n=1 Tax=Patulibacter brassicae TaxID=1705717 RepID=A0ABU4VNX8_9ACTN|nr:excisionase family DNA-binding protein [Patulibacter brassicae]MDX8152764.1 excisionase family DNA-binding protein [Patulibacter brassicae]
MPKTEPTQPPVLSNGQERLSFSINEVADRRGLTRRHVREQIAAGRLRAWRAGNTWRVDREDEEAWIAAAKDEAAPKTAA